jgi:hypothetical protein
MERVHLPRSQRTSSAQSSRSISSTQTSLKSQNSECNDNWILFELSDFPSLNSFGDGFSTISKMIDSVTTFMNKDYHKEQFMRFAEKANKLGLVAIEKSIRLAEIEIDKNIYWRNNLYSKLKTTLDQAIKDLRLTA